jgi:hypothetical protein
LPFQFFYFRSKRIDTLGSSDTYSRSPSQARARVKLKPRALASALRVSTLFVYPEAVPENTFWTPRVLPSLAKEIYSFWKLRKKNVVLYQLDGQPEC